MELLDRIVIPELVQYLLGVLGLLALWQFYRIQVLAGRIYAGAILRFGSKVKLREAWRSAEL